MVIEKETREGIVEQTTIRRTDDNKRSRPDAEKRQELSHSNDLNHDKLNLINNKDLEWLAWNWRAWINQKKFKSRRLMVFNHFNKS